MVLYIFFLYKIFLFINQHKILNGIPSNLNEACNFVINTQTKT